MYPSQAVARRLPASPHQEELRAVAAGLMKPLPANGHLPDALQGLHQSLISLEDRICLLTKRLEFVLAPESPPPPTEAILTSQVAPPSAGIMNLIGDLRGQVEQLEGRLIDVLGRLAL